MKHQQSAPPLTSLEERCIQSITTYWKSCCSGLLSRPVPPEWGGPPKASSLDFTLEDDSINNFDPYSDKKEGTAATTTSGTLLKDAMVDFFEELRRDTSGFVQEASGNRTFVIIGSIVITQREGVKLCCLNELLLLLEFVLF